MDLIYVDAQTQLQYTNGQELCDSLEPLIRAELPYD